MCQTHVGDMVMIENDQENHEVLAAYRPKHMLLNNDLIFLEASEDGRLEFLMIRRWNAGSTAAQK
jgi:hypothetical protein